MNFSAAFEPQRKSCDVRVRNTLWSLFSQDDESKNNSNRPSTSTSNLHPVSKDIGDSFVNRPVLESKEEEDDDDDEEEEEFHSHEIEISNGSSNNDNGDRKSVV